MRRNESQIEEFTVVNDEVLLNFNEEIGQKHRCAVVSLYDKQIQTKEILWQKVKMQKKQLRKQQQKA